MIKNAIQIITYLTIKNLIYNEITNKFKIKKNYII